MRRIIWYLVLAAFIAVLVLMFTIDAPPMKMPGVIVTH